METTGSPCSVLKADKYLPVAHGSAEDVAKARSVLAGSKLLEAA